MNTTAKLENGETVVRNPVYDQDINMRGVLVRGTGRFVACVKSGGNFCGLSGNVAEVPEDGSPVTLDGYPIAICATREEASSKMHDKVNGSGPDFRGIGVIGAQ